MVRSVFYQIMALTLILTLGACSLDVQKDPRSQTNMVSVEGSDTMESLLNAWEKTFESKFEDIPVSISIQDSGAGIKALIEHTTDIAATSRDLTDKEQSAIHKKGFKIERKMVALDSIAVVVNKNNPVEKISIGDLRKVYSGEISTWQELGGADQPINVLSRENESGTYRYFTGHVMKRLDTKVVEYTENKKIMTSNEALLARIKSDENAIGYCGLSVASQAEVKLLAVGLLKGAKHSKPTLESVSKDYPLSRPLYLFYDAEPKPTVKQFVEFAVSPEGQKVVKKSGYVSIN